MIRVALVALVISAEAALGASADGDFAIDGLGTQSCSSFAEAYESDQPETLAAYASWTEGFLTGVNVFSDKVYDITPWQTTPLLLGKLAQFCQQNPDTAYLIALGQLVTHLQSQALEEPSEIVQIRTGGRAVALPHAVLKNIAEALSEARGVPGEALRADDADGMTAALKTYQRRENLPQTGLPDQRTLDHLLR